MPKSKGILGGALGVPSRVGRVQAVAQLGPDWVGPYWFERQVDPRSPAFVAPGPTPGLTNVMARSWTTVGTIGSKNEAIVDQRGLVTPRHDGWSLDWWVGAEDRWHLPSRESGVRQQLVDSAPVVETLMRVPGGDAVHRAYGAPGPGGAADLVVVEVENRSPVPFVVALAIRPFNLDGLAVVERVEAHGTVVTVDGRVALLLPKAPARAAGSTFATGDVAGVVLAGTAGSELPEGVRCAVGMASAAFLFPVPHTAVLRVAIPLDVERATGRRPEVRRRNARASAADTLPTSTDVASGWGAQMRRGMRLELPPGRIAEAVEANRRYLLLFHDGLQVNPGATTPDDVGFRDAASLIGALDRFGFNREGAEVLTSYAARQHLDGGYSSHRHERDANGAALHAMAEHWRLTRDLACLDAESIARGVRWIERTRRRHARRRGAARRASAAPAAAPEHPEPFEHLSGDAFWSLRGLLDGAELLRALGHPDAAQQADEWAAGLRRDLDTEPIGSLEPCWPLRLAGAAEPIMAAATELIRSRLCIDRACVRSEGLAGLDTSLTLQLAFVELDAGDRRALDRVQWLVENATDTFTWPEVVHPLSGGGCLGHGHHGVTASELLSFVRCMLVRERAEGGLALCSMLPDGWLGQPIEVHDAPTHAGVLSFAVRWHGDRPALLWDLRPHAGVAEARITCPDLDPRWSTVEHRGEALLGPVDRPVNPRAGHDATSFG